MKKDLPMLPVGPMDMDSDEAQTTFGLISVHNQMNVLAQETFSGIVDARTLATLLLQKGLISEEEYKAQRAEEERQLMAHFSARKVGERMSFLITDKYALTSEQLPEIDCESRYEQCQGACCALRFPLTRQDLVEGVVRWEFSEPYLNRQGTDRRCVHQDRETLRCAVYEQRPGICRTYSCRDDKRIWLDFEQRVINPELVQRDLNGHISFHFVDPNADAAASTAAQEPSMEQASSQER